MTQPASTRETAIESLFGPDDGWSLAEIAGWLIAEGRLLDSLQDLVGALALRLVDAGLPIGRLSVFARTLHPQIFVEEALWLRGAETASRKMRTHGVRDQDDYAGSPIEAMVETQRPYRHRLTDLEPGRHHDLLLEQAALGLTDYYGQLLSFSKGPGGLFIICSDHPDGFSEIDLAKIDALARILTPVVEVMALHAIGTALLDTYLGHRSGERVMDGQIQRGDGEEIEAALWLSDLRDFTALTENLPVNALLGMLNIYFEHVDRAASAHGGEILSFIGDAMLIVFPVDAPGREGDACRAALDTAKEAFHSLGALNDRRRLSGDPEIRFGVGLHLGRVIYGNVGAPARMDFTVMGSAVNRTARLEALTKSVGTPLLMSRRFAEASDARVSSHGRHAVKGIADPIEVFGWDELNEQMTGSS